jgi:hypothetical protein
MLFDKVTLSHKVPDWSMIELYYVKASDVYSLA